MTLQKSFSGSTLLEGVASYMGYRIDQVNFISCQICALLFGLFLRKYLHYTKVSHRFRHIYCAVVGIALVSFCYGTQVVHLIVLSTLSYAVLTFASVRYAPWIVTPLAFGYLLCIHATTMLMDDGTYTLDVSGPLMIMVQRITSLACSVYDGVTHQEEDLYGARKKYASKRVPRFWEYYGYLFQFQCILAGPNVAFVDYVKFIDGTNFRGHTETSPRLLVAKKLTISVICVVFYLTLLPRYPITKALSAEFYSNYSWSHKMWFLYVNTTLVRAMYYHAWVFSDAICNISGLGFSGLDDKGRPKWDLATNVDILGFELGTNVKGCIDSWNVGTNAFLRHLVYDRVSSKRYKVWLTFAVSAVWHGFYPGYYIFFASLAQMTIAGRMARRYVRPIFQRTYWLRSVYDVITFSVTRCVMAYISFPFVLHSFLPAFRVYSSLYFVWHGLALLVILLPFAKIFPIDSRRNERT